MRVWKVKDGLIEVSGDQVRYLNFYSYAGYTWSGSKLYLPANIFNVEKILRDHKHDGKRDTFTPAFVQLCLKTIDQERTKKGKLRHLKEITIENVDSLMPLIRHKEPRPFKNQKVGLHWMKKFPQHALLWEMGTGKTRSAIENFVQKKWVGKVSKVLVVCPVSMLCKWVDEVEKWSNFSAVALIGIKEKKIEMLEEDYDFYVINYESLVSLKKELLTKIDSSWMIVADETTKIKNPLAKRTKTLMQLAKLTEHKLILTGTPITQHAYDAYTQFLFLDNGKTFGLNYDRFIDEYFWRSSFKLIPKHRALEQISDKIYAKSTRFRKEECIDIPQKLYDIRKIELTPYIREKYEEMVKWCITQIQNQIEQSGEVRAPIILTQLLRLSQITSGFVVDEKQQIVDFEDQPKIEALKEIIEESSNGNKILVWARFQHDVEKIMQLCKELEIKAVDLYGETDRNTRIKNISAFQNDPTCRILIGTAGTGGLGIDLTAAQTVVYYSNSYSLEQRLQSEDRTHRAGLQHKVLYIDLLANKTIDIAIYSILRQKKRIADIITKDNIWQVSRGINQ